MTMLNPGQRCIAHGRPGWVVEVHPDDPVYRPQGFNIGVQHQMGPAWFPKHIMVLYYRNADVIALHERTAA